MFGGAIGNKILNRQSSQIFAKKQKNNAIRKGISS